MNYRLSAFNWFFFINSCIGLMNALNGIGLSDPIHWAMIPSAAFHFFLILYWLNRLI